MSRERNGAGEGCAVSALCGTQIGAKETQGNLPAVCSSLTGGWRSASSPREQGTGKEEMASSCASGGSGWTPGRFFSWEGWLRLEQAAQGRAEITISGTVHQKNRPSTQCSSLLDKVVIGHSLDDFGGIFQS